MDCVRILLTGCNRGLGRDVLNLLAQKNKDYLVVGTARMGVAHLQEQIDQQNPDNKVQILPLNIISDKSKRSLMQAWVSSMNR